MPEKVTLLRTRQCRKSDVVLRFLRENNIPHEILYMETDPQAQRLAKKFNIMASPGIIIGDKALNPYELVARCQVKKPEETRALFRKLLDESS